MFLERGAGKSTLLIFFSFLLCVGTGRDTVWPAPCIWSGTFLRKLEVDLRKLDMGERADCKIQLALERILTNNSYGRRYLTIRKAKNYDALIITTTHICSKGTKK